MKFKSLLVQGIAALSVLGLSATAALAMQVDVLVDKATQHMIVKVDGVQKYDWLVSSGAPGYDTPSGNFHIFRLDAVHFSKEWDDAPMPHSMFFTGWGHALHGSFHVKTLGSAVSHGCVRIHPDNAAILFALIQKAGFKNNTVSIRGTVGLFQQEKLLTTDETFKTTPEEHSKSVAAARASGIQPTASGHPFWWQQPQVQAQPVVNTVAAQAPKIEKPIKKVKLDKKKKKLKDSKDPNFFDWLKNKSDT